MRDICLSIEFLSKNLNPRWNWAITGGANFAIRDGSMMANDVDIISSKEDFVKIVRSIFYVQAPFNKTICGNIRSLFFAGKIFDIDVEIMSDVENFIKNKWILNEVFFSNIEKKNMGNGFSINLMSIEYERRIDSLIKNQ